MKFAVPEELVSAYLDGEVTSEERAIVERAMADSPEVRRLYRELQGVQSRLQALPRCHLDGGFTQRLLDRIEREAIRPSLPDRRIAAPVSRRNGRWRSFAIAIGSLATILLLVAFAVYRARSVSNDPDHSVSSVAVVPEYVPHGNSDNPGEELAASGRTTDSAQRPIGNRLGPDMTRNVGTMQTPTFVMVMDLTITPEGQRAAVFEDALTRAGVRKDPDIQVDEKLESKLLASRFIGDVEKQESRAHPGRNRTSPDEVEMTYVIGPGLRIDAAMTDLRTRPATHIARWKFDMAIEPTEKEMFNLLHTASRLASTSNSPEPRAHRLTFRFSLKRGAAGIMGSMARPMIQAEWAPLSKSAGKAATQRSAEPQVSVDLPAKKVALSNMGQTNPDDEPCAVLFILRNLAESQQDARR
jgi:anti-sigma factor RsiW